MALAGNNFHEAVDPTLREQRSNRLKSARERRSGRDANPIGVAAAAVAETLDSAWIVDESVTGNFPLTGAFKGQRGDHFISTTGGSLGWGPGAAVGVAMATQEKVVCFLGDGAFFFGLQSMWLTAARSLPITYVVLDNGGFGSTRWFEQQYLQRHGLDDTAGNVGSDFRGVGPAVETVASGFGIPSKRLAEASELQEALRSRLDEGSVGPALYVVPIPFE
jgi:thiamine pyrophosphate-dependent acetolactate synthase large subunit-like protein